MSINSSSLLQNSALPITFSFSARCVTLNEFLSNFTFRNMGFGFVFFRHFDKDKSGRLNHQEFKSCLRSLGYDLPMVEEGEPDPEFESILDTVDPNRYVHQTFCFSVAKYFISTFLGGLLESLLEAEIFAFPRAVSTVVRVGKISHKGKNDIYQEDTPLRQWSGVDAASCVEIFTASRRVRALPSGGTALWYKGIAVLTCWLFIGRDGHVSLQEYMAFMISRETENVKSSEEIESAFRALSSEGKPYVTKEELYQVSATCGPLERNGGEVFCS